jgi:hypothetical protein
MRRDPDDERARLRQRPTARLPKRRRRRMQTPTINTRAVFVGWSRRITKSAGGVWELVRIRAELAGLTATQGMSM